MSYSFEALHLCTSITLGGEGFGIRGMSSMWESGTPVVVLFARVRGPRPLDGLVFLASVARLEADGIKLIWEDQFTTDQRGREDEGTNLFVEYAPEFGLLPGQYVARIWLVAGPEVQSSFEVR